MSVHTPGPWTVGQSGDDYVVAGTWAGVKGNRRVLSIRLGVIPSPANARLIAAAPRMLALLRSAPDMVADSTTWAKWDTERRAILRDVEGESNG